MSRHRSPGGRRQVARHRADVVHHGMGAAVAGGALAALVPALPPIIAATPAGAAPAALSLAVADADSSAPRVRVSITPVASTAPEPAPVDVAALVKAAGIADRLVDLDCGIRLPQLGAVKPWAADGAHFISCIYDEHDVLGVGGRGRRSDHPGGWAVDVITAGAKGDRIARCVLDNRRELGVSYVIWKQRINYGDGWDRMEDRGSVTENHYDHVHVSFDHRAPHGGRPDPARCS